MASVLVMATHGVVGAILTESALSFLGIGVQPPTPSRGNILTARKDNIDIAWWLSLYPGLAILTTLKLCVARKSPTRALRDQISKLPGRCHRVIHSGGSISAWFSFGYPPVFQSG